jgi:hypothetical protein
MTRRSVLVALLALVLALPALALAQTPNFSGKWAQDMEKSQMPAGGGGGRGPAGPQSWTYTQSATELVMERETPNGVMKTVYKLDGSPSVNAGGRGGEVTSKSAWEGSKLVTKYTRTMGENSIDVVETRYMDGENLVVESVMKTPNGERTSKLVFKKG